MKPHKSFPDITLEEALQDARVAAHKGHKIAYKCLNETSSAIETAILELQKSIEIEQTKNVKSEMTKNLQQQFAEICKLLTCLNQENRELLKKKKAHLNDFTITLFGRTMAGKSTLMEILTMGDGSSIGKGAQRTTRDVRRYRWHELLVTDVPGIAAFEGAEDEALAFDSAAQADLILFLITTDAPQPVEAECLSKVIRLGKPVLGICNVRASIRSEEDIFLFLRKPEKYFDPMNLGDLITQFHAFVDMEIPGKRIPFVFTHLDAKFISLTNTYGPYNERLRICSNFEEVERTIIREVKERGTFIRMKSFIDLASAPMNDLVSSLMENSAHNSSAGKVLIEKKGQASVWAELFKKDGLSRIDSKTQEIKNSLYEEMYRFIEDHYQDKSAYEKWNLAVSRLGIDNRAKTLQKEIFNDCKKSLEEIAREIKNESEFASNYSKSEFIKTDQIYDFKRWTKWANVGVNGVLAIGALAGLINPGIWVFVGVAAIFGFFEWFFDDKDKRIAKAKENLRQQLIKTISKIENEFSKELNNWFKHAIGGMVCHLLDELNVMTAGLFTLADSQRNLAWDLSEHQKGLAKVLLEEALKFLNSSQYSKSVAKVSRVPGRGMMILLEHDSIFPRSLSYELEDLIGENIFVIFDTKNPKSIVRQGLQNGILNEHIWIDYKINIAYVQLDSITPELEARINLVQQLINLQILKRND